MFNGYGTLTLEEDHLDLSFREPDKWPNMTPGGAIKTFMFDMGDPDSGPVVQLGLIRHIEGDVPDWERIDPAHFHGTDQFRVIPGGEWTLAGRPLNAGSYAFQEAGRVYREHGVPNGSTWLILVVGDKRGLRPTIIHQKDRQNMVDLGEYAVPYDGGDAYPHPAGPKGIAAIATTSGPCQRGYLRGEIGELPSKTLTGVFGDETLGPVAHLIKSGPNETVMPACRYATERFLIVSAGSCIIGDEEYRAGDMRVQRADTVMDAIVSGPDGLEAALVIGDRRARPSFESDGADTNHWMFDTARVVRELSPAPGGQ